LAARGFTLARYNRTSLNPLNGGVHRGLDQVRRPPQFSPALSNIRIRDGVLQKRPGSRAYASGTLAGTIVSGFEYKQEAGTTQLIAVTGGAAGGNRKFYTSTAGGAWTDNTGAVTMVGTALDPYDAAIAPNPTRIDNLYISNGFNSIATQEILKWDGTTLSNIAAAPGSARTLCTFANRLCAGNIYDGTQIRGSRFAWSADGDADTWSGATYGEVDLVETPDPITKLLMLGSNLVIYKERSIFIGSETGIPELPIRFSLRSRDVGAIAPFSVASAFDRHFFLSYDDVYEFDGAGFRPIGEPIRPDLRGINASALRQVFSVLSPLNSEYWLFVPVGSSTVPSRAYVFNWAERHWTIWDLPQGATCGFRAVTSGGPTWITVTGTWEDYASVSWDALDVVGAPTSILGMADLTTDEYTYLVPNDNGAGISAYWESKDEDMAGQISQNGRPITGVDYKTLSRVTLRLRSSGATPTISLGVSVDGGATYSASVSGEAPSSGGEINFDVWLTGTKFRIRIANSTASEQFPQVEEITLHYHVRGEK